MKPKTEGWRRRILVGAGLLVAVAAPVDSRAGITAQGITAQGITAQGITAQGITAQGITAQGITAQGITAQGITAQGITAQGITAQGITAQGITAQGITAQGIALMGTDLVTTEMRGVDMSFVTMRGTTPDSDDESHELTAVPGMSTGTGNHIVVSGRSPVGHYAVAHFVDADGKPAENLDLFIAEEQEDQSPNLFHRAEEQDNRIALYVVYFFHRGSGQWMSLCPYNALTESASAMSIPEDPKDPNKFFFACTATGVAAKCARNWGYRPWASTVAWVFDPETHAWKEESLELRHYYDSCKLAARAAYCQDPKSFTKNGTMVDLFDTRQIIWPNAIENPWSAYNDDSRWMFAQEYLVSFDDSPFSSTVKATALQRTRYRELSPAGQCDQFAFIDRLEHDRFEDARWADPLTSTPRIEVRSPTYCAHDERTQGGPLPWDCSPCTAEVCKSMPGCCSASAQSSGWNHFCVQEAKNVCRDGAEPWPAGRVWPTDLKADAPAPPGKFLLGPQGSVLRVDASPGPGGAAKVSGWACDPEWPGATVAVEVWSGPRDRRGSAKLGDMRADLPLALPLAREVSAACDGPKRDYARHGFSLALPPGQKGEVFVYALDEATADGPAAPPTLIRNGVVRTPVPPPSPPTAPLAVVTTGWIEAPVTGAYAFDASAVPGRLWVNGTLLADWWSSDGPRQGTIELMGGVRYALRWDRLQGGARVAEAGLRWRPPGATALVPVPPRHLYQLAPGAGAGLKAVYFAQPGFSGTPIKRTQDGIDPVVDIGTRIVPPSPIALPAGVSASNYSAVWEGEIVPFFTEDYTFSVAGSGAVTLKLGEGALLPAAAKASAPVGADCSHDLCSIGEKLASSGEGVDACDPCVDQVCARDPYCCNGGYLSYYSSEPAWDAKCIAEVKAYCNVSCTKPVPNPVSPVQKSAPVPLRAGVHYRIRLTYENNTSDDTLRLMWASARQPPEVIPSFALYPAGQEPLNAGAGLDVATFETVQFAGKGEGKRPRPYTTQAPVQGPDQERKLMLASLRQPMQQVRPIAPGDLRLGAAISSGATPNLELANPVGPTGLPLIAVLARPEEVDRAVPSPPSIIRPRFNDAVLATNGVVKVNGLGGIRGGSVQIGVQGEPDLVAKSVPVRPDGTFEADVEVGKMGLRTLVAIQRNWTDEAPKDLGRAHSQKVTWDVAVTEAKASGPAPVITTPRDPTISPDPRANVFQVSGYGTSAPLTVTDEGGSGAAILSSTVTVSPAGKISGTVTLTDGATSPSRGWHKLVFTQGGVASKPVFVSVGIDPPAVDYPRSGAVIDCDDPGVRDSGRDPGKIDLAGRIRHPELGKVVVAEEDGRGGLALVRADVKVDLAGRPEATFPFKTALALGPGRHVLHVFQVPDLPGDAPAGARQKHLRAFASLADTPETRIVVDVPPPTLPVLAGASLVLPASTGPQKLHLEPEGCGPGPTQPSTGSGCNAPGCGVPQPGCDIAGGGAAPAGDAAAPVARGPGCALPFADVTLKVGRRVYTTRAGDNGHWSLDVDMLPGWNDVELTQVVATNAGGTSHSCPSNLAAVGVVTTAQGPKLTLPDDMNVEATSPKGAKVLYDSGSREELPVNCRPASGATFPVGKTFVNCAARDPKTGAIGLGRFSVTVANGAPVLRIPTSTLVLEATGPQGAKLPDGAVSAIDAAHGALAVECTPPLSTVFPIDKEMPVSCRVVDPRVDGRPEGKFLVQVRDTAPPKLCPLDDVAGTSPYSKGIEVPFKTCADDLVDGSVGVSCNHPSGSFFPVGKTEVSCTAIDRHGNRSAPETFIVWVRSQGEGRDTKAR